jgi:hypothetical protein
VDFAAVGLFAMVPNLVSFLALNIAGWATDTLIRRGNDITRVRKVMQTIGFGSGAVVLAVVGYISSAPMAIALMTVGAALGAWLGGWGSNHTTRTAPCGNAMGIPTRSARPGIIGVYVSASS